MSKPASSDIEAKAVPADFISQYETHLKSLTDSGQGVVIDRQLCYDVDDPFPGNSTHYQCAFMVRHLRELRPQRLLDVGSYREFILGTLAAGTSITTVDIRAFRPQGEGEVHLRADAAHLPLRDASFDGVTSMSALEHFGLGRYGDPFALGADVEAAREMARVLRPGGRLLLTAVVAARGAIVFNAHRVYTAHGVRSMFSALAIEEEAFVSRRLGRFCAEEELTEVSGDWDFYCGRFRRPV
jgi:SAM-dependent methyltransferase